MWAGASSSSGQTVFELQEPFRGSPGYRIVQISGKTCQMMATTMCFLFTASVSALDVPIWENKARKDFLYQRYQYYSNSEHFQHW